LVVGPHFLLGKIDIDAIGVYKNGKYDTDMGSVFSLVSMLRPLRLSVSGQEKSFRVWKAWNGIIKKIPTPHTEGEGLPLSRSFHGVTMLTSSRVFRDD